MGDYSSVSLCTTHEEMYIYVISLTSLSYQRSCLVAVVVFAISYGLLHIGFGQTLQYQWVCTLIVVALKLYHFLYLLQ